MFGFQVQLAFERQYGNPCLAYLHLANTLLIVEYWYRQMIML